VSPSRGSQPGGRSRDRWEFSTLGGATTFLDRYSPEALAGAFLVLLMVLVLAGFMLGAARVSVRLGVWAAAAGALVIVATGLLYAFRLRASGPPG
jgi:hypothetical protein